VTRYDETQLAELLQALPPAPAGWVQAAQELPTARRGLDDLVGRAVADAEFRKIVEADLAAALAQAGIEPDAVSVAALRARLASS
jgi:hypothetical protein